jgi:NRPS condensation-like uncharacterized protein
MAHERGETSQRAIRGEMADALIRGMADRCGHLHLHLVVDLRRGFTETALEAAVAGLIDDYPVLGCRYVPHPWRDRWEPWGGEVGGLISRERVDGPLEVATARHVDRPFELEATPPFRVAFLEHGAGCRLMLSVHHMVADGGGLKAMANDVAARLSGVAPDPRPGCARGFGEALRAIRARDLPRLGLEAAREALRPLSMLRVHALDRRFERDALGVMPRWRTVSLRDAEAARFADRCRGVGATLNDGLVATVARLAAARGHRGPVAAAYTIDLRRHLAAPRALVTNLHAVAVVTARRDALASPEAAIRAISKAIGEQKRRLFGLSYVALPALAFGWLPHGLLRRASGIVVDRLLAPMRRALALTNIGALDRALAPFGADACDASILGPFVRGLDAPVVVATGFKGSLTLHVCAAGHVAVTALDEVAAGLGDELALARES